MVYQSKYSSDKDYYRKNLDKITPLFINMNEHKLAYLCKVVLGLDFRKAKDLQDYQSAGVNVLKDFILFTDEITNLEINHKNRTAKLGILKDAEGDIYKQDFETLLNNLNRKHTFRNIRREISDALYQDVAFMRNVRIGINEKINTLINQMYPEFMYKDEEDMNIAGKIQDLVNKSYIYEKWRWLFDTNRVWFETDDYVETSILLSTKKGVERYTKFPFFIYKFRISFKQSGRFETIQGNGYHPNKQISHPAWSDVCLGDLSAEWADVNILTVNPSDLLRLYQKTLIMLKTVNLESAYWQPKKDLFLEKFNTFK